MRKRKRMKVIKKIMLHKIIRMYQLNRFTRERIEKDIFFFIPNNIYFKLKKDNKCNCQMCCMEKHCCAILNCKSDNYIKCLPGEYFEQISEIEAMILTGG